MQRRTTVHQAQQSLRCLDNCPEMQAAVTNQSLLFAEAMLREASTQRVEREYLLKQAQDRKSIR